MTSEPSHFAQRTEKYTCTRCGWQWTPRPNSPDPPHACARCRSAYWQSAPVSSRANSPNDPKWQAERESVARRRQRRHLERLRQLAAEFNLKPTPVLDGPGIALSLLPAATEPNQPSVLPVDPRIRFNEPVLSQRTSTPSIPPESGMSLSERLRRLTAEWEAKSAAPPSNSGGPTRGSGR
jgi:hypothetical protein